MYDTSNRAHIPGYRGIVRDISEAGGALTRIDEIVDYHGFERLLAALDIGLLVYRVGDAMFVGASDFRIYCEMLDRSESGDRDDVDDGVAVTDPTATAD